MTKHLGNIHFGSCALPVSSEVSSDDAKAGVSDLGRLLRVTGPDTQKQRIDISAVTGDVLRLQQSENLPSTLYEVQQYFKRSTIVLYMKYWSTY